MDMGRKQEKNDDWQETEIDFNLEYDRLEQLKDQDRTSISSKSALSRSKQPKTTKQQKLAEAQVKLKSLKESMHRKNKDLKHRGKFALSEQPLQISKRIKLKEEFLSDEYGFNTLIDPDEKSDF